MNPNELPVTDKTTIAQCPDGDGTAKRTARSLAFGLGTIVALAAARLTGVSADTVFWIALLYVVIATLDRAKLGYALARYQRIVGYLADELED